MSITERPALLTDVTVGNSTTKITQTPTKPTECIFIGSAKQTAKVCLGGRGGIQLLIPRLLRAKRLTLGYASQQSQSFSAWDEPSGCCTSRDELKYGFIFCMDGWQLWWLNDFHNLFVFWLHFLSVLLSSVVCLIYYFMMEQMSTNIFLR